MSRVVARHAVLACLLLVCSFAFAGNDVAGTWNGSLTVPGGSLRFVLHVNAAADGTLSSTVDSPDQGANGLPVDKTTFDGTTLHLSLANLDAEYEGTVTGNECAGTWKQRGSALPLKLTRAAVASPAAVSAEPGTRPKLRETWSGTLDAGMQKLRLVMHVATAADGTLSATMDSIDQGANGVPFSSATLEGRVLKLEMPRLAARYEGTLDEAGLAMKGTWMQGGMSLPLDLAAVDKAPELRRPQVPSKPYPYVEEEVSYENATAGVKFGATLTLPKGPGPFPAVVLITGSGSEDRDESVFGHKPFLILADHLTRKGIAVLRADDRGVGGTTVGKNPNPTSGDFAGDALAAVAYLKQRKEIDPKRIGLVGHSEGGMIAPLAATRSKDVAFIVLMAGPGLPGEQIMLLQTELILRAEGAGDEQVAATKASNAKVYKIVREVPDAAEREKQLRAAITGLGLPKEAVEAQVKQMNSEWMRYFMTYDPRPTLAQVKVPVLAINGERDLQVPPKQNLAEIGKALEAAKHKDHEIVELPGLNHLFQECKTGSITEYSQIEQTMSPAALDKISTWILAQTKK